jgi:two-component sensor histidine kinase
MNSITNVISRDFLNDLSHVGEPDHRIANSLQMITSLLRLQLSENQRSTEPVRGQLATLLGEAVARIEAVAELHRHLSMTPGRESVDLDQYLRTICNGIVSSLPFAGKVEPQYLLTGGQITSPDVAISVGLIVTELLTNSIKYSHPTGVDGKIVVASKLEGDHLVIEIDDDGVGLPVDFHPKSDGNLGYRLIRSLAAKCGATLDFRSTDIGLRVRLILPEESCLKSPGSPG